MNEYYETVTNILNKPRFSAEKYLERYTDLEELGTFSKKLDYMKPLKDCLGETWELHGALFWIEAAKTANVVYDDIFDLHIAIPVNKNKAYWQGPPSMFLVGAVRCGSWSVNLDPCIRDWAAQNFVTLSQRRMDVSLSRHLRKLIIMPALKKRRAELKALVGTPEYEAMRLSKQQSAQTSAIVETTKELTRLRSVVDDLINGLAQNHVSRDLLRRYSKTVYEFGTYRGRVTKPIRAAFSSARKRAK